MCKFSEIQTSFYQSDLWLNYFRKIYPYAGRIYKFGLAGQFFEVQTKIAGKGWIFPHAPYNYNFDSTFDIEQFTGFINYTKEQARKRKVNFIKFVPMLVYSDKCFNLLKKRLKFLRSPKQYEYASWHAFLALKDVRSVDALFRNFSGTAKRLIKKSINNFSVDILDLKSQTKNDLRTFWNGLMAFSKISNKIMTYEGMVILRDIDKDLDNTNVLLAEVRCNLPSCQGKIVGYAVFTIIRKRIFYKYGAFSREFPKDGISYLLFYYMFRYAIKERFEYFSLWGVNLQDFNLMVKDWQGFTNFKLRFNPQLVRLIGPLIFPVNLKGNLAYIRDLIGHIRLLVNV